MDCQESTPFKFQGGWSVNPDFLESPRDFFQTEQTLLLFRLLFTSQGDTFRVRAFEIWKEFIGC